MPALRVPTSVSYGEGPVYRVPSEFGYDRAELGLL